MRAFFLFPSLLFRSSHTHTSLHVCRVAYLILSCFATTTVVLIGTYGWIKESHLIQDRLYGEVQSGSQRYLSIVMLAYQSWNIWCVQMDIINAVPMRTTTAIGWPGGSKTTDR